jgi:hypothetical protein
VDLPQAVASLLAGRPTQGRIEQAFPVLTVDDAGFPHVCLLSRAQLQPTPTGLTALVSSPRTRANLRRRGIATLIAMTAEAAHYCKLRLIGSIEEPWALAAAFELVEHKADQSPVPLSPATYVPTNELEAAEQWDRGLALLRQLGG